MFYEIQEMPDNSQITITVIIINIIVIVIAIRVINAIQQSVCVEYAAHAYSLTYLLHSGTEFPIRQTKSQIIRHREMIIVFCGVAERMTFNLNRTEYMANGIQAYQPFNWLSE